MINLGDKFRVANGLYDDDRTVIEEVVDKDSTNDYGDITVYFDTIRYYEDEGKDEPIESYSDLMEWEIEDEVDDGKLVPMEDSDAAQASQ